MASSECPLLEERIQSLQKWPSRDQFADVKKHAEAGFYFDGDASDPESLTCAFCRHAIGCWETKDDPVKKHVLTGPCCLYIVLLVGLDHMVQLLDTHRSTALLGELMRWWKDQLTKPMVLAGLPTIRFAPKSPDLQETSCRRNTMDTGQLGLPEGQKAELAMAGFYMKGQLLEIRHS